MNETHIDEFNVIKKITKSKEASIYLVKKHRAKQEVVIKQFTPKKSEKNFLNEVHLQHQASIHGLSPRIFEYSLSKRYIVMEKMESSLPDLLKKQGKLHNNQIDKIIKIFKALDKIKIFHSDPNPFNIMIKDNTFYIIDFGFAKAIDLDLTNKHNSKFLNMKFMPLGLLIQLKKLDPSNEFEYLKKFINTEDLDKCGL